MPRKTGRRGHGWSRIRMGTFQRTQEQDVENGGSIEEDPASYLRIGSKNKLRWSKMRRDFGFTNDGQLADYLLSLLENQKLDDSVCQPPMTLALDEVQSTEEPSSTQTIDNSEDISLLMECEDHSGT